MILDSDSRCELHQSPDANETESNLPPGGQ